MSVGGDLPVYSGDETTCQKCGHDSCDMRYAEHFAGVLPGSHGQYYSMLGSSQEAMVRSCDRCGFTWAEQLPTVEQRGPEAGKAAIWREGHNAGWDDRSRYDSKSWKDDYADTANPYGLGHE